MHRKDAEDAMDAYCDADPLGTGRRLMLRWGKNVKKVVKFGTGGVPTNLRKKPREKHHDIAPKSQTIASMFDAGEVNRSSEPIKEEREGAVVKNAFKESSPSVISAKPSPPNEDVTSDISMDRKLSHHSAQYMILCNIHPKQ